MNLKEDNFALSAPHPYAIFLPAVNSTYAQVQAIKLKSDRRMPANITLDDLAFWTGKSKLWNHKFLLHSIGNYAIGANTRSPLFKRVPGSYTIVGDSGGYQLGRGKFDGFDGLYEGMSAEEAEYVWKNRYDEKCWIIHWLDYHSDYAMTLDLPLWALTSRGSTSPFHKCSESQLLALTVDNLRLIEREMEGRTKWLNVVQANTLEDGLRWYDGVRWFKHGGWSMAGNAGWRGGLFNMLTFLLTMRDDDAFSAGQEWLHVLGVSQPKWDIFLTAMQRGLRKTNERLQVSCDSATAFDMGGRFDRYAISPALGSDARDWSVGFGQLEQLRSHSDQSNPSPFPAASPLGNQLMMHHIIVDGSSLAGRRLDTISNMLLINHSLWVYLDAGRRANAAAFGAAKRNIPAAFAAAIDIIEEAFSVEQWALLLQRSKSELDLAASQKN